MRIHIARPALMVALLCGLVATTPSAAALPVGPGPCGAVCELPEPSPCQRSCTPVVPHVQAERSFEHTQCAVRGVCVVVTAAAALDTHPAAGEPMVAMSATWDASTCPPLPPGACEDSVGIRVNEPPQCGAGCEPADIRSWVVNIVRNLDIPVIGNGETPVGA